MPRYSPPARLLLTEPPRAALEAAGAITSAPLLAIERRGDGHPVLVLPGLLGGDLSTLFLRSYLRWLNYSVSGWDLGRNFGPTQTVVNGLRGRLAKMADAAGEPVSLVGWSLGGLYAHDLARRTPSTVRQVVTLGSPLRRAGHRAGAGPLRVPATAVYTRSDGIVPWQSCRLPAGKRRENVEVYGSHIGLAQNPTVLHLLADRLAQAHGKWHPFRPGPVLRHLYP